MVGQLIAHYRVLRKLGEGGMGVVYQAKDTHLDRLVAIKVLPPERATAPERKARFVQEAKAASALNHPNIITIYDIGADSGLDFIAMEYVNGKTLDQLIPRKGMRLSEALKIAVQIADALSRAHAAGIIHRDLKPANIMVDQHGLVKVLDFGLAKLREREPDEFASTETMKPETGEGTIVGTAGYMSPEQAEGKKLDARSDIFSFGSVLYEMITGRRAFRGDSMLATLSAILHQEPAAIQDAPPELEKLIARCLRKDPERRAQHMSDLKLALEELKEESDSGKLAVPVPPRPRARVSVALIVAGILVLVAFGLAWAWRLVRSPDSIPAPALTRLTADSGLTTDPALSPDGKLLAYASDRGGEGNLDIYVQQVRGGEPIRLTRDPADEREPAFSPDGTRIAFRSDRDGGGVYIISALGGEERLFARGGRRPRFSPDGNSIVYWTGALGEPRFPYYAGIFVQPATGGAIRQIQGRFQSAWVPVWAPDGKHILFQGSLEWSASRGWWVAPLEGNPVEAAKGEFFRQYGLRDPIPVAWLPEGNRIVFTASSGDTINVWQVAISPKTWQVTDRPRRLTSGAGQEDRPSVAVGPDGTVRLAFSSLIENVNIWALPIDANHATVAGELQRLTQTAATDGVAALTADGQKMFFGSTRSGGGDIWVKDLVSGRETKLTDTPSREWKPVTTADGRKIAYKDNRTLGIHVMDVAWGSGSPQPGPARIISMSDPCGYAWSWSSDGKKLLYNCPVPGPVYLFNSESGETTQFLRLSAFASQIHHLGFSPDDRWIALTARLAGQDPQSEMLSGREHIFVTAFDGRIPAPEKEWIPLTVGKLAEDWPTWSPDGNLLYFFSDRDGFRCAWAQRLDPGTKRPVGSPLPVFHSHAARRSFLNVSGTSLSMSVAVGKMVFPLGEATGNIWMAEWKER